MISFFKKIKAGFFTYQEVRGGWIIKVSSALDLLKTAKATHNFGIKDFDCFSPFPIHGLEKAMGIDRSWLNLVTLVMGVFGGVSIFSFMTYISTRNWPLHIGGKPHFSWPAFLPSTFEVAILFAALSTVVAFIFLAKLYKIDRKPILDGLSSDSFAIWIPDNIKEDEVRSIYTDFSVEILKTPED